MGKNIQKKLTLLIFTLLFTLAAVGAVSAADNSSDNLTATSVDQATSKIIANQTGTDPQIEHLGIINPTVYTNIQDAINAAQPGDTIWLENGGYFTGVGNTQITISKNLIFNVFSGGTATIDGLGTRWGFAVDPGVTATFNNIIFQNFIINSYGAAIRNEGVLSVTGCTFTGNTAPYSGAIGNIGTCTVTDCTFTGNSAAINGGAIANDGNLIVTGSTFTGNTAGNNGGAIASDGTLNVNECTFTSNNAGNGGAISNLVIGNYIGTAQIHFCRIVGNTANTGNAIFNSIGGSVNAENNWWGSNNGPLGSNFGIVDADPWIILKLSASPSTINNGATSTLIADLTRDNYNNLAPGNVPDGIPVTFSLANGPYGSLTTPLTRYTNAGQASIIFTANVPNAPHTQTVAATVDNQYVSTDIYILPTADLVLTKTVDKTKPVVKDTVTFTLIVNNHGPDTAVDVTVNDKLPAGLTYVSSSANYGAYNPNTGIWTIGNLPNGETAILTIKAVVEKSGQITNQAKVSALTYDPNIEGNTASATLNVQAQKRASQRPRKNHWYAKNRSTLRSSNSSPANALRWNSTTKTQIKKKPKIW